ncbi:unnamed protein product [Amaranthus hypochondriacus]
MKIFFIFLLSLILLAGPSDGRKDLEKYWGDMMKGEPMPESLKQFIISKSNEVQEKAEIMKDFLPNEESANKIFGDEFEPIINLSVYNQ